MATDHLAIPDILGAQDQKEATANTSHNLLDRAINANASIAVSAGLNTLTNTQARENGILELTGTPGAVFQLRMPDTNKRTLIVVNNADDVCTVENSAGGGTGQPVISIGEASIFHYDGVNFIDITGLAIAVSTFTGLTDTPSAYTSQSGKAAIVDDAEAGLQFDPVIAKPVRVASTAAQVLADDFENGDTIDAIVLSTGDRILIKDQAAGEDNGVYVVEATGAPTRAGDFNDDDEVTNALIPVLEGTANGSTLWHHSTTGAITLGTTSLTFVSLLAAETFTSLTDTPSGYTDESGKTLRGNAAENAVEFVVDPHKDPVRVATDVAGTLASDFEDSDVVDGITLATGDRILIKDQSAGAENGIYIVEASGGPTRAIDWDDDADAVRGSIIPVIEGTINAESSWIMTTSGAITIGTTATTFVQMLGRDVEVNPSTIATLQTTDDTVTDIATISVAAGETVMVRGFGVAQGPSTASVGFEFIGTAHNAAGTTTLTGQTVRTHDDQTNSYALTIDADDTGDTLRIRATGIAATTIDWRISYETVVEA